MALGDFTAVKSLVQMSAASKADLLDAGVIQLTDLSQENQNRRAEKLALREELAGLCVIPEQAGFPYDVQWPDTPASD
jgi:hypothetical protein